MQVLHGLSKLARCRFVERNAAIFNSTAPVRESPLDRGFFVSFSLAFIPRVSARGSAARGGIVARRV